LATLIEHAGSVVSKEELFARVWPNTFVEEANLKVHVAALRKALRDGQAGNRFIVNVPGRGYSFVAVVVSGSQPSTSARPSAPGDQPANLPSPIERIVGRSDTVLSLTTRVSEFRFVTIVGPGGIGKTTVALAVANALAETFRDGVKFIDLSPLTDPNLVPTALAAALGVAVRTENAIEDLIAFLKHKQILLVFDNCEHVIGSAASLTEQLLRRTGGAHILATSREPLRALGERILRLPALTTPSLAQGLTALEALAYPAVQLFVDRASATLDEFELGDADAPIVAELCRKLDGIPLAIEIAASRIDAFGVAGLASRLGDQFRLLMRGRRTALKRHQTLSMTYDWSYELLPEVERAVLRRLAVFAGSFTLDSASDVIERDGNISASEVLDCIINLVSKSLVSATSEASPFFYRLLETTRTYAAKKLDESRERDVFARKHAEHYLNALARAELEWRKIPAQEWTERHRHLIDNVRAALDWAFSSSGDPSVGVSLTAAAVPLWFHLALTKECCERVQRALSTPVARWDAHSELRLQAALAWSLMQTSGSVEKTRVAWDAVLSLSEKLADVDYQLRALWGLWAGALNAARLREALAIAERFHLLAAQSADPNDSFVGDRLVGYILHLLGEQTLARPRIDRMIKHYATPTTGEGVIRYIFDQRVTARCFLARILWLQGFPDQAVSEVEGIMAEASSSNDMLTMCQALVQAACPIAVLVVSLQDLDRYTTMLLDNAARNALGFWQAWGRCFRGVFLVRSGDTNGGLTSLREGLEQLRQMEYGVYYVVFLCEYAQALGAAARTDQGLSAIDAALERSKRNEEYWYLAELMRAKGELLLLKGGSSAVPSAENLFRESFSLALRQETPAWELRAATSLLRLQLRERGPVAEFRALLKSAYQKFEEGFATTDLVAARELLDSSR
jgi:predicted ATPase